MKHIIFILLFSVGYVSSGFSNINSLFSKNPDIISDHFGNQNILKIKGEDYNFISFKNTNPNDHRIKLEFPAEKSFLLKAIFINMSVSGLYNFGQFIYIQIFTFISSVWLINFVLFFLLLGLIIGFLFYAYSKRRIKLRTAKNEINTENETEKINHIFRIAQELLTPLSLVVSPLEDLIKDENQLKPEWRENLKLIYKNSNYLKRQINQIINVIKQNSLKGNTIFCEYSLATLIKDVADNFQRFEQLYNCEIVLDLPEEDIICEIDTEKLEGVLYNLISNVFKISQPRQILLISLRKEQFSAGQNLNEGFIVISIGNHINHLSGEEINEKSTDIDNSPPFDLSYSRSIIEMHKGIIQVDAASNNHFTIKVFLPDDGGKNKFLVENKPEILIDKEFSTPFQEISINNSNGKKYKVVLVEDNDDLRNFLGMVISNEFDCLTFENGLKAFETIRETIPDIVIADVIMPEMDGLQLCRKIKEDINTCHIPVILLTARVNEKQIIEGYEYGADAYITKPFSTEVLLSQVIRLIKNRKLIREKYLSQNFMVDISDSLSSKDDEFIMNLRKIIEENITDVDLNVKKLSRKMNISDTQLYRKVKSITGYSPVEFIRILKLKKSCELLKQRNHTVKEVCYQVGFNNLSYFVKCFREHFGVTPAVFRDRGFSKSI